MAYVKTNWVNNSAPALNASNLNKIEDGIFNNDTAIENQFFNPGDVYDYTYPGILPCAGLVTTSTTTIFFSVTLPKRLDRISSISVNTLTGGARGISGYVNGTSDSTNLMSGYTVSALIMDAYTIRVQVVKSSALTNVTNNTPVTVSLKSIKLTLS